MNRIKLAVLDTDETSVFIIKELFKRISDKGEIEVFHEGNNILHYLKYCISRGEYPEIMLAAVNEIPEFAEEYLDLLAEVNKRCRVIIIAITSYNNLEEELSTLGFKEFLEKPMTFLKLKAICG